MQDALGEQADGKWSAFEVGIIVSRQNGKGSILEARALAGLFLLEEQLILHSAHEFKTAADAFRRVLSLIENTPDLKRRVKRITRSHGDEGIELHTGQRLRFVARTGGSGRGFSADCVILDEAYNLGDAQMAALLPTLSARPNPQVWYTSSAGNETSVQLGRVHARGNAGNDPSLAYFEWSVDPSADYGSPDSWAQANPGMGIRISAEHIARERAAMAPEAFAQERLGIGTYPTDGEQAWSVISEHAWRSLYDRHSKPKDPVAFSIDVTPERSAASIAVAGASETGGMHVEIVDHRPGTDWIPARIAELVEKWDPCAVVLDRRGPAASLMGALQQAGVEVQATTAGEMAEACGAFFDAVTDSKDLKHTDDPRLNNALAGALTRDMGDGAWGWTRKGVQVDISPLVAVTLAAWAYGQRNAPTEIWAFFG